MIVKYQCLILIHIYIAPICDGVFTSIATNFDSDLDFFTKRKMVIAKGFKCGIPCVVGYGGNKNEQHKMHVQYVRFKIF